MNETENDKTREHAGKSLYNPKDYVLSQNLSTKSKASTAAITSTTTPTKMSGSGSDYFLINKGQFSYSIPPPHPAKQMCLSQSFQDFYSTESQLSAEKFNSPGQSTSFKIQSRSTDTLAEGESAPNEDQYEHSVPWKADSGSDNAMGSSYAHLELVPSAVDERNTAVSYNIEIPTEKLRLQQGTDGCWLLHLRAELNQFMESPISICLEKKPLNKGGDNDTNRSKR